MGRDTDALRIAKSASQIDFLGQITSIVRLCDPRTISIMLVDSSGSMSGYEDPVMTSVNGHLDAIKSPPDGSAQHCMVVTFRDKYRIEVPLSPAANIKAMTHYWPNGGTLLYETLYLTLKLFLEPYRLLSPTDRSMLKLALGIFTDGDDTSSDHTKFPAKLLPLVAEARRLGVEFCTYGFRFDAAEIARKMGLPDDSDHAISVAKSAQGIAHATGHFTRVTTTFFSGQNYDSSATPTGLKKP